MAEKLTGLKKQALEGWKRLESRFLESHSFNLLSERYQSLSSARKKWLKRGAAGLALSALAYFPLSYFISSALYWGEFRDKRDLSFKMLKARSKASSSLFRWPESRIKRDIEALAGKYSSSEFKVESGRSAPLDKDSSVYQRDFSVRVSLLNVRQAVRLGTELRGLPQARLNAITMEESAGRLNRYDVIYKLSAFFLKEKDRPIRPLKKERKRPRRIKDSKIKKPGAEDSKKDSFRKKPRTKPAPVKRIPIKDRTKKLNEGEMGAEKSDPPGKDTKAFNKTKGRKRLNPEFKKPDRPPFPQTKDLKSLSDKPMDKINELEAK